jgi:hypothetical protein
MQKYAKKVFWFEEEEEEEERECVGEGVCKSQFWPRGVEGEGDPFVGGSRAGGLNKNQHTLCSQA